MEPTVTEVAPDIFRISIYPPGSTVSFGCFLIRDDAPTMVETGLLGMFNLVHGAVRRLIDPSKLRYLASAVPSTVSLRSRLTPSLSVALSELASR